MLCSSFVRTPKVGYKPTPQQSQIVNIYNLTHSCLCLVNQCSHTHTKGKTSALMPTQMARLVLSCPHKRQNQCCHTNTKDTTSAVMPIQKAKPVLLHPHRRQSQCCHTHTKSRTSALMPAQKANLYQDLLVIGLLTVSSVQWVVLFSTAQHCCYTSQNCLHHKSCIWCTQSMQKFGMNTRGSGLLTSQYYSPTHIHDNGRKFKESLAKLYQTRVDIELHF